MLESPVHVDTASLAIFNVVLIRSSTLWALCHNRLLSLQLISLLNQTLAQGCCDCLCPVCDLQLPVNILHLTFDLNLAPEQLLSNLSIITSLRSKPHYPNFPLADSKTQAVLRISQSMKLGRHLRNRTGFTEDSLAELHRT